MELRRAVGADVKIATEIYLRSRAGAGAAVPPGIHPPHEVEEHVGVLIAQRETWLAVVDDLPVGVLVVDGSDLDWLWVLPEMQGRGVGTALLEHARTLRPEGLELWVFTSNLPARRFYERRGFVALYETDGSGNEERAPDVRYGWPAPHG